jgi:hypothetical protein
MPHGLTHFHSNQVCPIGNRCNSFFLWQFCHNHPIKVYRIWIGQGPATESDVPLLLHDRSHIAAQARSMSDHGTREDIKSTTILAGGHIFPPESSSIPSSCVSMVLKRWRESRKGFLALPEA